MCVLGEQNHNYYIQTQEEGWRTLSIFAIEDENGCSAEELVADETQDVETEAIMCVEVKSLRDA